MEPQATTPQNVQPVEPPKPPSKLPLILLVLGLLLIVGIGGFVAGSRLSSPTTTPAPVVTIAPTPDSTSTWKSYSNIKLALSFRYPNTWDLEEAPPHTMFAIIDQKEINIPDGTDAPPPGITIATCESIDTRTNLPIKCPQKTPQEYISAVTDMYDPASLMITQLNVDQAAAIQLIGTIKADYPMAGGRYEKFTVVKVGDFLVKITLHDRSLDSVYNQILSTFKFTQTTSSCPAGTVYYDNKYFSVCHPAGMTTYSSESLTPDTPPRASSSTIFENNSGRFVVGTAFIGGWGGSNCSNSTQTVSNTPATILIWDEDGQLPCNNFTNMVALIGGELPGTGNLPVAVDYQRSDNGPYLNPKLFETFIDTLKIK